MPRVVQSWSELIVWVVTAAVVVVAYRVSTPRSPVPVLDVSSPAFSNGDTLPSRYRCAGGTARLPPFRWGGVPRGTHAIALVAAAVPAPAASVDPAALWAVWNIPPQTTGLAEDPRGDVFLPSPASRDHAPGGCGAHTLTPARYEFQIYALDQPLRTSLTGTPVEIEARFHVHVLAKGLVSAVVR